MKSPKNFRVVVTIINTDTNRRFKEVLKTSEEEFMNTSLAEEKYGRYLPPFMKVISINPIIQMERT